MSIFGGKVFSKVQFMIGLLQFLTIWSLIGYVWSIAWAILVFWKSRPAQGLAKQDAMGVGISAEGLNKPNPFENPGGFV